MIHFKTTTIALIVICIHLFCSDWEVFVRAQQSKVSILRSGSEQGWLRPAVFKTNTTLFFHCITFTKSVAKTCRQNVSPKCHQNVSPKCVAKMSPKCVAKSPNRQNRSPKRVAKTRRHRQNASPKHVAKTRQNVSPKRVAKMHRQNASPKHVAKTLPKAGLTKKQSLEICACCE